EIDQEKAQQYATAIEKASDQLSLKNSIAFSEEVTVQGNPKADSEYANLTQAVKQVQTVLNRDVQNIYSVVANFENMDKTIQKVVTSVTDGITKGEGGKK